MPVAAIKEPETQQVPDTQTSRLALVEPKIPTAKLDEICPSSIKGGRLGLSPVHLSGTLR
jgi:hypothetical protein